MKVIDSTCNLYIFLMVVKIYSFYMEITDWTLFCTLQQVSFNAFFLLGQIIVRIVSFPSQYFPHPTILYDFCTENFCSFFITYAIKLLPLCKQQMEVPCYPEKKLEEFSKRIRELKHEYTAFLRKLKTLEPDTDNISWNNRPYSCRKRCKKNEFFHVVHFS